MKEIILEFLFKQHKPIILTILLLLIVILNFTIKEIKNKSQSSDYAIKSCFDELGNKNYEEAINIANKVKKENKFLALLCLAEALEKLGYYNTAYSYLIKAYPFIESYENILMYYLRMFSIYANHNDIKLAMDTLQKIYKVVKDENIKKNLEDIVKAKNITDEEIINEAYFLFFKDKRQWQVNELRFLEKFKNRITESSEQTSFFGKIKKIIGELYDNVSDKSKQE